MKRKLFLIGTVLLVLLLALCACGAEKTAPAAEEPAEETPAAEPEAPLQASVHFETSEWPVVDGALACLPYYEKAAALLLGLDETEAGTYILSNNTPASFQELADGEADMIFCLHASRDQTNYAASKGVEFEYLPFANDAFVFFVNKDNPVDSVSMDELRAIYAGEITNWKELGGRDEAIIAYQRNEGSGSQTGLYEYVISQDEVMEPLTEQRIGEMGMIIDAVADYENASGAIGYSYLYFVTNQHFDDQIKLLQVNGVAPDAAHIISGEYPMVTQYCLVMNAAEPEDSVCRRIADWCRSEEGQVLAEALNYVPIR
jgi:phosphate transport system substrate-binding protein